MIEVMGMEKRCEIVLGEKPQRGGKDYDIRWRVSEGNNKDSFVDD